MEGNELQVLFFQYIKSKLPSNISLADEIADILSISSDSVYRRIRGEKILSIDEVSKIASYFKISVDQLLNLNTTDAKTFSGNYITPENFNFDMYLQKALSVLVYLNSFTNKELIYFCKDIAVFHYFSYPELAAFKNFAWIKTLLQFPAFAHEPFHADVFEKCLIETGIKIAKQYSLIPGHEIMNVNNIHTTLYQIEYYKTAHMFRSDVELSLIYEQLHAMVNHIEAQAENGMKFMPGEKVTSEMPRYNLYVNDFVTGDNSNLAIVDGNRISYMVHSHINYLVTTDEQHTSYQYNFLRNVMQKSILLSKSSEKLRAGFFI